MSPRDQTLLCLSRPWRRGEWGVTWLQHNCKCNQPWRPACKPQRNCYLTWSDGLQVVTASCGHYPGEEGGERRVTRLFLKSMISAVELCWDWCWSGHNADMTNLLLSLQSLLPSASLSSPVTSILNTFHLQSTLRYSLFPSRHLNKK